MTRRKKRNLYRLLEQLQPEADEDAPFGQYLFAPERKDLKGINEPNTTKEDELYDALDSWYSGYKKDLEKLAPSLKNITAEGDYEKVLVPDGRQYAYRLINDIPLESAARIMGVSEDFIIDTAGKATKIKGRTLNPNEWSNLQSWTTSKDYDAMKNLLKTTDQKQLQGLYVAMIFSARVNDSDFLVNPDAIHNIEGLPHYAYDEEETISVGPVKASSIVFVYNPDDSPEYLEVVIDEMTEELD